VNFVELQAAVTNRLALLTGDQIIGTAAALIVNEALHECEIDNVNGWNWLRKQFSFVTVAGTKEYPFTTVSATFGISKIVQLKYAPAAAAGVFELGRLSLGEADDLYPLVAQSSPEVYAVDGQSVFLVPIPNAVYTVTGTCIRTEPDLTGTDTPIMPLAYQSMIVEKAVELFARRTKDFPASKVAHDAYVEMRTKAIAHSRPYVGSGRVRASSSRDRG
jgi:hypothetical protein